MHAKSFQSCPTICDPIVYSLPGSSVHADSPGKITGVGCHAFLSGVAESDMAECIHGVAARLWQMNIVIVSSMSESNQCQSASSLTHHFAMHFKN